MHVLYSVNLFCCWGLEMKAKTKPVVTWFYDSPTIHEIANPPITAGTNVPNLPKDRAQGLGMVGFLKRRFKAVGYPSRFSFKVD
jgi:hypothetical protein